MGLNDFPYWKFVITVGAKSSNSSQIRDFDFARITLGACVVMRATREQCDRVKAQQKIIKVDAGEMTEVDKKSAFRGDGSETNR